jgi:stage V sporulation protein B
VPSDKLIEIAGKAAHGGVFLFVGNALSVVILAVGSIAIARLLGPSNYGLYTLSMVMPLLFVSLADAGMNYALVRFPAKLRAESDYAASNRAIRLGFLVKLSLGIAAFLICYFGADTIATTLLNRSELSQYLQLAGLLIVFQSIFDAATYSFIGLDLMQFSASTQILYSVVKSTLAPALILLGFGINGAIAGYALGVFTGGVVGATVLFTKYARSEKAASLPQHAVELRALFDYSLPLYVAAIFAFFFTQYQNLVLARLATNTQIGNFNAAWNFNSLLSVLVYPISTAIFPMFSKMDPKNQTSNLARGFVLAVKYTSLFMIPASVGVMIFSRDLIYLTYGVGYTFAPQYLLLLSAIYFLTAISYLVLGSFLSGVADTTTLLKLNVLALLVYLPLGPVLTLLWGPFGLLAAYILSNAISTICGIRQTSNRFNARPDLNAGGRILLAALGAAVPTMVFIQADGMGVGVVNLIAGGLVYLAFYLSLAPLVGAVNNQDILNLKTLLGHTRPTSMLLSPIFEYEFRLLTAVRFRHRHR